MKNQDKHELLFTLVLNMRMYQKDGEIDKAKFYEEEVDKLCAELSELMWED